MRTIEQLENFPNNLVHQFFKPVWVCFISYDMVKLQLVNNRRCLDCLRSIGTRKKWYMFKLDHIIWHTVYNVWLSCCCFTFFYGKNQEEELRYNHSARDPWGNLELYYQNSKVYDCTNHSCVNHPNQNKGSRFSRSCILMPCLNLYTLTSV